MVELNEDNIVVKKVEGGSIISHAPLFSENGRLVIIKYKTNYLILYTNQYIYIYKQNI